MCDIGPIIDASKYYYENDYYVEMFSDLLQSACDTNFIYKIHPSFVNFIKELSPLDAKLLNSFNYNKTYPIADILEIDKDKKITPFYKSLFYFYDINNHFTILEHLNLTNSLNNLIRLGLVKKNKDILKLNYNYDDFKNHFLYKIYENLKENPQNQLKIVKYRIELTETGINFLNCCIKNKKVL